MPRVGWWRFGARGRLRSWRRAWLSRRQDVEEAYAAEAWRPTDRMFTDEVGGQLTPMVLTHAWNRMQEAASVPHVRMHDLRHLLVFLLVRRGLDPRTVADRIGRADPAFTLRHYSRMFEEQRAATAVNVTELLRRSGSAASQSMAFAPPRGLSFLPDRSRSRRRAHGEDPLGRGSLSPLGSCPTRATPASTLARGRSGRESPPP